MLSGSLRIAVDIGGTFTDLQVLEERSGRSYPFKVSTTPDDPSRGLMDGVRGAAAALGFDLSQVRTLMHGTTIATNAVLEHALPTGALVTTQGFRDVLEIGRHVRDDIYAAVAPPRRLLIERARRFEVGERIGADGTVVTPLDEAHARKVVERIAASGAECVAVCLLHAYANAEHERRLGEIVEQAMGPGSVSCSHRVSPELREYERTSTTVLNALLMPVVRGYLERLQERMQADGFAPALYLVQSNGGVTTPAAAAEQPARLLLSGPSGGALAAQTLGAWLAQPNLVGIDMGGTSFDVSVIQGGAARIVNHGEVDGCPVRLPMVEIRTIGAGGGSIAAAEDGGRLQVGPRSAGAVPGPVCYGRGGSEPTVTDANVALGRIDPGFFLGGGMALDADAARAAVEARVGRPLALDVAAAAEGIVRIAVSQMAAAIRLSLFEKGLDPKDFALLAFGGAGGLHAAEVAAEVGARRVVYPRNAGTLSAWGMLFSDVVHDGARTRLMRADDASLPEVVSLAEALLDDGRGRLEADGLEPACWRFALSADYRYPGQAYEITVPLDSVAPDATTLRDALARFHDSHEGSFAHANRDVTPELVTLRMAATGVLAKPGSPPAVEAADGLPQRKRRAHIDGCWQDVAVHARASLGPGASLTGPVLIEEDYATITIPAGWRLGCGMGGELVAERET